MPFVTMMIAANTVSRATTAESGVSLVIIETIRPTSMTVTASASTTAPSVGPTRSAITSAWCTALVTETPSTSTANTVHGAELPPKLAMAPSATIDNSDERWLASMPPKRPEFEALAMRDAAKTIPTAAARSFALAYLQSRAEDSITRKSVHFHDVLHHGARSPAGTRSRSRERLGHTAK